MKYALIAVVVLMSWGQPAAAQTYTVLGQGLSSCGAWTKSSRQDGALHWTREAWVLGFVTASSIRLRYDLMHGTDNDAIAGWIDNYCRDNPTNNIVNACNSLVDFLRRR